MAIDGAIGGVEIAGLARQRADRSANRRGDAGAEIPAIVGVGADRIFRGARQAVTLDRADCERIGIAAELRIVDRDADRTAEARRRAEARRVGTESVLTCTTRG